MIPEARAALVVNELVPGRSRRPSMTRRIDSRAPSVLTRRTPNSEVDCESTISRDPWPEVIHDAVTCPPTG